MLTIDTSILLCKFLRQYADEEKKLEILRQILCEQQDFEPNLGFNRIDRDRKSYLTAQNIQEFLSNNGYKHTIKDCTLYIKHYTEYGKIEFEDFLKTMLPAENEGLKQLTQMRKTKNIGVTDLLSYDLEYAMARIFDREIQIQFILDKLKIELHKQADFNAKYSFETIDKYNSGYITLEMIGDFMYKYGFDMYHDLLEAIIRSMDQNNDKRLDIQEWFSAITPHMELTKNSLTTNTSFHGEDPMQNYKNKTSTTQAFYKNEGLEDPSKFFQTYLPVNNRSTLSIKKHIQQNQQKYLKSDEKNKSSMLNSRVSTKKESNPQEIITKETSELMRTFKQFIILDKQNENCRQELVLRNDFNYEDAFRLFDVDGKGKFSSGEFENCLKSMNLYPTKPETYLVLKRYDRDNDGRLSFAEFCDFIRPYKKEYQNVVGSRCLENFDIFYDFSEIFSLQTRQNFLSFIQTIIENEAAAESLRQRLNKRKNFDLKKIFSFLDYDQDGFITPKDLQTQFDLNGIQISNKDLAILMYRIDKNNDGVISYSEFIIECSPNSTQKFY